MYKKHYKRGIGDMTGREAKVREKKECDLPNVPEPGDQIPKFMLYDMH